MIGMISLMELRPQVAYASQGKFLVEPCLCNVAKGLTRMPREE